MAKSGFWFQQMRGRAIVRNRCMRKARAAKACLGLPSARHMTIDQADDDRRWTIRMNVSRARQAHHDWMSYRKLHHAYEVSR